MDRETFLDHANHRLSSEAKGFSLTPIDTSEEAEPFVEAVLQTLGERLPTAEAEALADGLPDGIDQYVAEAESGQEFDHDEFLNRIADRADVDSGEVSYYAKAIVSLVYDAGAAGDELDLQSVLPEEYDSIFEFTFGSRPWDKYEDEGDYE